MSIKTLLSNFQLSENLELNDRIKAVNLPKQDFNPLLPLMCSVTGWGAEEPLGDVPLDMRSQSLITVFDFVCNEIFNNLTITLPEDMTICANNTESDIAPCTVSNKIISIYVLVLNFLNFIVFCQFYTAFINNH